MLPTRSHSRADAPLPPPPPLRERGDSNPSPVTSAGASTSTLVNNGPATIQIPSVPSSSVRASPQKSQIRTYDSKLISREMDRLAATMHTPPPIMHSHSGSSHTHSITPAGSTSTLTLVPSHAASASMSVSSSNPPLSSDNPWSTLHVLVLPLFNGEALRVPLEDLNTLVKKHLNTVVSRSPSRAVSTLEGDVVELLAMGMITLNAKLTGIEDDKLVARVVDLFGFFWDQILPYVEGVFLPLQMDPLLLSLHRKPAPSDSPQPRNSSVSAAIDIRTLALKSFRDCIILGFADRLHAILHSPASKDGSREYRPPRLQQMLLVLMSIQSHSASLTMPTPAPSPGEHAIISLLRATRNPHYNSFSPLNPYPSGRNRPRSMGPSSFSGGAPRDRRGRIARKEDHNMLDEISQEGSYKGSYGLSLDGTEDDTPTVNGGIMDDAVHRYRSEREFLDSLKSPVLDAGETDNGRFNFTYDYDSDEHSDDASDLGNEIQR
ncbi:hypothetical protein FRC02_007237, partial [Tulasnella sp. 418]